jgi:hypothetical protein
LICVYIKGFIDDCIHFAEAFEMTNFVEVKNDEDKGVRVTVWETDKKNHVIDSKLFYFSDFKI